MPVKIIHADRQTLRRRQRGDTMIEVLVTIIVIAVGVLGAAALQVTTLKNLSSSHSATVAALVAEDMTERIRANPVGAANYVHSARPVNPPNCTSQDCTPAELAAYDIGSWWNQMTALLPSASGTVTNNAGTFTVTVRWDEDRSGSTGTNCPPESADDLECYQFNVTM